MFLYKKNLISCTTPPFIIVALDYNNITDALDFVDNISPLDCRLKIGNEMFTKNGPNLIKLLNDRGFKVFLDLKYHDIPTTVSRAVIESAEMGVWMVNIHAIGGIQMIKAARNALRVYGDNAPLLTAVTVLTSMNEFDFNYLGIKSSLTKYTKRLALLSKKCGLDGVICSVNEIKLLKKICGSEFKIITPGIRPIYSTKNEHKYTMTPIDAIKAGADYIVIGRPITRAKNQSLVLKQINLSINEFRDGVLFKK